MKDFKRITRKLASDYVLTDSEKNEINDLLGGLILYLIEDTDSLVPAFVISDLDVSIYESKYERNENGEVVEESPAGYEINDYKIDFVRNPDNHELVISYKQLLEKMKQREYAWDWEDLKKVERDGIKNTIKECIANRDWIDVDKTYIYDEYYSDAILREGKSRIKLGVKCGEDYFTVFVLRAKAGDDVINEATDWLANRQYKQELLKRPLNNNILQRLSNTKNFI